MPSKCPMMIAFVNHRCRAQRSKISFQFSFEEWKAWWKSKLGPEWMKKRGCRAGQYVMARFEDRGPYAEGNVKCVTCETNNREAKHLVGEDHYWARLTAKQVIEARSIYIPHSSEFGGGALARKYGVSVGAMVQALRGESWSSVGPGIPKLPRGGSPRKLTAEKVLEARRLYVPGHPSRSAHALAKKYGVCVQTMWEVVTYKTWPIAGAEKV